MIRCLSMDHEKHAPCLEEILIHPSKKMTLQKQMFRFSRHFPQCLEFVPINKQDVRFLKKIVKLFI